MSRSLVVLVSLIGLQTTLSARAAPQPPTEAPAGFDTETLVQKPGPAHTAGALKQKALS
jgi:hypothetical protein